MTWNAVDKSGKRRIHVPALSVLQSKAMSHNESESDSDAMMSDEAGVLGDSDNDIWSLDYVHT